MNYAICNTCKEEQELDDLQTCKYCGSNDIDTVAMDVPEPLEVPTERAWDYFFNPNELISDIQKIKENLK